MNPLLNAVMDDGFMISYRPKMNEVTGSVTATILLNQVKHWWKIKGRKPFYKFKQPCTHPLYKKGDSWCEELGFSRSEFDLAIAKVGQKLSKGVEKDIKKLVYYNTDRDRVTWYCLNEDALEALLLKSYPALAKADSCFSYDENQLYQKQESALYITENTSENTNQSTTTNEPSEREYLGTTSSGDESFSIYLGQSEATGLPHVEGGVIASEGHNDLVSKSNEVGVDFDAYKDAMEKMCRMNISRIDRAVRVSGRHREFFLESFTQHCFDKGFEIRHKRKEAGFLTWLDAHADFLRENPEYEAEKVEVIKPITKTLPKKPQETNAAPLQEDNLFTEYWERYNYKDRAESLKIACLTEWQKLANWEKVVIKRALPVYLDSKEEQYRKRPDGWLREKAYKEVKLELDTKLNNKWGDIEDELNRLFWNDANQFVATWQAKKRQGYLEELLPQFEQAANNFKNEKLQNRI